MVLAASPSIATSILVWMAALARFAPLWKVFSSLLSLSLFFLLLLINYYIDTPSNIQICDFGNNCCMGDYNPTSFSCSTSSRIFKLINISSTYQPSTSYCGYDLFNMNFVDDIFGMSFTLIFIFILFILFISYNLLGPHK